MKFASPIEERDYWLAEFEARKAELLALQFSAQDAENIALSEIRKRIREQGFRE